jgi:predicted helicase
MVDCVSDLQILGNSLCFPLYRHSDSKVEPGMFEFDDLNLSSNRQININPNVLNDFSKKLNKTIKPEDLFYYTYGMLHSPSFLNKYKSNLVKEIARIPFSIDFDVVTKIGKYLGDLHVNYESVKKYELTDKNPIPPNLIIESLEFTSHKKDEILVNKKFRIQGFPPEVHFYKVNNKSPLEWVVDRYNIKTNKDTLIENDANLFSQDSNYVLDLIYRSMTIGLQTYNTIKEFPEVKF